MGSETTRTGQIEDLVDDYLRTGDPMPVADHLAEHSRLPDPRGALGLADGFAAAVRRHAAEEPRQVWMLVRTFGALTAAQAPTNDPSEFIAFCGVRGMAEVGAVSGEYRDEALAHLRAAAEDERWRVREAVAAGLQSLLEADAEGVYAEVRRWVQDGGWLQMRAAAAGLADPGVLKRTGLARGALDLHREVVERMVASDSRSEDYKVLRQGLGYTLSVVVAALPKEGFEYLRSLAGADDPDVRWVLKENLKKSRLIKRFPEQVDSVLGVLR